jgi:hypothetical protein
MSDFESNDWTDGETWKLIAGLVGMACLVLAVAMTGIWLGLWLVTAAIS